MKRVVFGFLFLAFFSTCIFFFKANFNTIGVASLNESLVNYREFTYGDYIISPGSNNTKNVILVLRSEGTVYESDGDYKVQVSLPQSKKFDLILGDSKNRVFFTTLTKSELGLQPNFKSESLDTFSQIKAGDTLVVIIPMYSEANIAEIKSLSDCAEYCQANLQKIARYNTRYLDILVGDKANKLAFLFENKRELGPAFARTIGC